AAPPPAISSAVAPPTHAVSVSHTDHVSSYQPDGTPVSSTIGSGVAGASFSGLRVYGQNHDVYANDDGTCRVFDPSVSLANPLYSFDGSDSPTGAMGGGGFGEGLAVHQRKRHLLALHATHQDVHAVQ